MSAFATDGKDGSSQSHDHLSNTRTSTTVKENDSRIIVNQEDITEGARTWSTRRRVLTCVGPILTAFTGNLSISIFVGSIPGVIQEFNTGATKAILLLSLAALGFLVGPLIAVSISEIYGRQMVFFFAIPIALIFNVVAAVAKNYSTLAAARFLASTAIAPAVTVAVGTINDVWDVKTEKLGSTIVVLYAAMQVWAVELGPWAGSMVVHNNDDNWRHPFWAIVALLGICCVTLLNRESYWPEVSRRAMKKSSGDVPPRGNAAALFKVATGRALHMLITEPIVGPTALMVGIYQAIIYCFYIAYPLVFERVFKLSEFQVGLCFLSLFVGSVLGLAIIGIVDTRVYQPALLRAQQLGGQVAPEKRLYGAILGGALMPIGLFWFAGTASKEFHWAVPLTSGLLIGIALICIMLCLPVYKNDIYGSAYGASSLAADNIIRYLFSFSVPLFTVQMIDKIGFLWSINLLAFLSLALAPVPVVIFLKGPGLRAKSGYISE